MTRRRNSDARIRQVAGALIISIGLTGQVAGAGEQESTNDNDAVSRRASGLLDEIVVTARKRTESLQDVPLSVSAYSAEQLEVLKVRNLANLSVSMPNVALDDVGINKGTANFSIRGLGINSSIPSIDPTVGVFVDGVYLGVNFGVIFDLFDLESIEVLRGPQGILFGRNVTGGAVLINTKRPSNEVEGSFRTAVDGGDEGGGANYYLMGSVSGPLSDTVSAKMTVYHNDDEGWFTNSATGNDFGAFEQIMIRPSLLWEPNENFELYLKYEYADTDSDGPAAQNHPGGPLSDGTPGSVGTPQSFDRFTHNFAVDEEGFQKTESHLASAELNWDIGGGTLTNILAGRDFSLRSKVDIDGQDLAIFHGPTFLEAEQFSNELRYNVLLGEKLNLTTGVYYFKNDIQYHERRELLGLLTPSGAPTVTQDGGGNYEVETTGVFTAFDYDLYGPELVFTGGLRYTYEKKDVQIASLNRNTNSVCNVIENTCPFDFEDDNSWSSWSPKIGLIWKPQDDVQLYTHWSRGTRSGGYNLRNSASDEIGGPGPFDEETVDNFELGFKVDFERGRLNGAVFYNKIQDMQREVNFSDPTFGIVQVVRNTTNTKIPGFELEGTYAATPDFLLTGSLGYIDPEYTEVFFDLNQDGLLNQADKDLVPPRGAKLTYNIGFNWDVDLSSDWFMSMRANYAHRDRSFFTDDNRGTINEQDIVNAGIDFNSTDGRYTIGIYGKNLTNEVKHGGDSQLPAVLISEPLGGSFASLAKGRHYGVQLTYNF